MFGLSWWRRAKQFEAQTKEMSAIAAPPSKGQFAWIAEDLREKSAAIADLTARLVDETRQRELAESEVKRQETIVERLQTTLDEKARELRIVSSEKYVELDDARKILAPDRDPKTVELIPSLIALKEELASKAAAVTEAPSLERHRFEEETKPTIDEIIDLIPERFHRLLRGFDFRSRLGTLRGTVVELVSYVEAEGANPDPGLETADSGRIDNILSLLRERTGVAYERDGILGAIAAVLNTREGDQRLAKDRADHAAAVERVNRQNDEALRTGLAELLDLQDWQDEEMIARVRDLKTMEPIRRIVGGGVLSAAAVVDAVKELLRKPKAEPTVDYAAVFRNQLLSIHKKIPARWRVEKKGEVVGSLEASIDRIHAEFEEPSASTQAEGEEIVTAQDREFWRQTARDVVQEVRRAIDCMDPGADPMETLRSRMRELRRIIDAMTISGPLDRVDVAATAEAWFDELREFRRLRSLQGVPSKVWSDVPQVKATGRGSWIDYDCADYVEENNFAREVWGILVDVFGISLPAWETLDSSGTAKVRDAASRIVGMWLGMFRDERLDEARSLLMKMQSAALAAAPEDPAKAIRPTTIQDPSPLERERDALRVLLSEIITAAGFEFHPPEGASVQDSEELLFRAIVERVQFLHGASNTFDMIQEALFSDRLERTEAVRRAKMIGDFLADVHRIPGAEGLKMDDILEIVRQRMAPRPIEERPQASSPVRAANVFDEIFQERARQISKGWDALHDDHHTDAELVVLANFTIVPADRWPPTSRDVKAWILQTARHIQEKHPARQRLVIGIALMIAELERRDREFGVGAPLATWIRTDGTNREKKAAPAYYREKVLPELTPDRPSPFLAPAMKEAAEAIAADAGKWPSVEEFRPGMEAAIRKIADGRLEVATRNFEERAKQLEGRLKTLEASLLEHKAAIGAILRPQ